ncbi:MAG: hypothetical protein AMXMBFR33_23250 [Candidatus Xenobia bacterium]
MSIRLLELVKRYGDLTVVNRVNLEIAEGELFVLLGGSGSGKSTILRLIAGLLDPDEGRVEMGGQDVTRVPAQKRGCGFVFQNYALFRHMSVEDNIEFALRLRGVSRLDRRRRSAELMELVGLTGLGRRFANQLSGGQQQRVALARALAFRPRVLLLDEPFGALDVSIRGQLRRSLKEIQRQTGVTSILVTHDQEEAFELADRIGVIERGHLIEVGPPRELYHRPRHQFTASFVGAGTVLVGHQERGQVRLGTAMVEHPEPEGEGALVRLLIRPENVRLEEQRFEGALWEGEVSEQVFAGPHQRVRLKVEGLRGARVVAPTPGHGQRPNTLEASLPSGRVLEVGQRLFIGLSHYHLLQPTGLRTLICSAPDQVGTFEAGRLLARAVEARACRLCLGRASPSPDPGIELMLRSGSPPVEIVRAAQEGNFELVVLNSFGQTAMRVLEHTESSVMVARQAPEQLARILILTAAGEPGKADVRMGGRIAARAGASVTVLHVARPDAPDWVRDRAERHLEQARSSLELAGVKTSTEIRESGDVPATILRAAEELAADLLVLGAPDGPARLARTICEGTSRPILLVPLVES